MMKDVLRRFLWQQLEGSLGGEGKAACGGMLLQESGREGTRVWVMMAAVGIVKKAWVHEALVRDGLPRPGGD